MKGNKLTNYDKKTSSNLALLHWKSLFHHWQHHATTSFLIKTVLSQQGRSCCQTWRLSCIYSDTLTELLFLKQSKKCVFPDAMFPSTHTWQQSQNTVFIPQNIGTMQKKCLSIFLCGLVTSGTSFCMGRFHPTNSVKTYRKQLLGTTAWARSIWQMAAKTAVDSYRCVYTRNRQDLIEVFKMCNGLSWLKLNELFTLDDNNRGTRGHSCKLAKFRCTRDCCIFSNRVINRWNQLDQRAVGASSINAFKGWLSKKRETRMGFFIIMD